MDLSPGVSVSGADLYAGLCIEGCLSFWREFGAPWEVTSKADVYEAYKAYKAFLLDA